MWPGADHIPSAILTKKYGQQFAYRGLLYEGDPPARGKAGLSVKRASVKQTGKIRPDYDGHGVIFSANRARAIAALHAVIAIM